MMINEARRLRVLPWIPLAFCAALSLITVVVMLATEAIGSKSSSGWGIGFVCFLPMCFFFVATMTTHLQGEIRDLRDQLAELRKKAAS
jgi:hypothetical protein